jgi:membrane-bound serine protease (ClpP class)
MMWCLLLFVLGVSLIIAEFFLPGGVCGIAGVALLIGSTGMGINAYPEYALFIIIGELAGACAGVGIGLYGLARTRLGQAFFLSTTHDTAEGFVNIDHESVAVGAAGVVLTALRPSGTIEVEGKRIDAVSDGDLIEEGAAVRVVEVHGNRVVVEGTSEVDTKESVVRD